MWSTIITSLLTDGSALDWVLGHAEALIVGVVVPIVLLVMGGRLRRENSEQHAEGRALVTHLSRQIGHMHGDVQGVRTDVRALDSKVDSLAEWQAEHELEHARALAAA